MNYTISETLGKGGFGTVKKAKHNENGTVCALKLILKESGNFAQEANFESEVSVMKELSHPNIISLLDYNYNDVYTNPYGKSHNVYSMALELASGGEMFDYIRDTGSFSEEVCRHYFHQLMDGLSYMLSKGIKHRDIKLENLLLDSNFVLKIADFGFASTEETTRLKKGTTCYLGPEAFLTSEFRTEPLDIFAAGIVLFTMYTACPPFNSAKPNNPHFKLFKIKNDLFWRFHEKKLNGKKFSQNFKDLLNAMLCPNPDERPNIDEIQTFEWYSGSLPLEEDIIDEFCERSEKLHEA